MSRADSRRGPRPVPGDRCFTISRTEPPERFERTCTDAERLIGLRPMFQELAQCRFRPNCFRCFPLSSRSTGCGLVSPTLRLGQLWPQPSHAWWRSWSSLRPSPKSSKNNLSRCRPSRRRGRFKLPRALIRKRRSTRSIARRPLRSSTSENLANVQLDDNSKETLPESQGSGFVWDAAGHIITNDDAG